VWSSCGGVSAGVCASGGVGGGVCAPDPQVAGAAGDARAGAAAGTGEGEGGVSVVIPKAEFLENLKDFERIVQETIEEKEERTLEIIREALEMAECPVLACSWGKDSFLMLHLVRKVRPDIPVVFTNTGVEFPETYRFRDKILAEENINYTELKPETTFWKIVDEYGYPSRSRYMEVKANKNGVPMCCALLKDEPAEKYYKEIGADLLFVGLTYDEGRLRRTKIIESGPLYYIKSKGWMKCLPIAYWSESDVFGYHWKHNLPLNDGYKHSPRIGCMPCTGHIGWEKQMAKANFKMYRKVTKDMGRPILEEWL